MAKEPIKITQEQVVPVYESKFIRVFDLQYAEGRHYYNATRRVKENIVATKTDKEFKGMLADAVTCVVILVDKTTKEHKLLMSREYRYPAGRFLLSPPAGIIDEKDKQETDPLFIAAKREIYEETGIKFKEQDEIFVVNPCLFSSPGMTDESNAIVCAVINDFEESMLSQSNAEETELFDGFVLLSKDDAKELLQNGKDKEDIFYSVYAWIAMMYFVTL